MQCESCHAEIPGGKIVCPNCSTLQRYNVRNFDNTAKMQSLMKQIIAEQSDRIVDKERFFAIIYDYSFGLEDECALVIKAVKGGILDDILAAENKKKCFDESRKKMMKTLSFSKPQAEFILAVFGHLFGFAYQSPLMIVEDDKKEEEEKEKSTRKAPPEHKIFKKFDSFKYKLSKNITVKDGFTKLDGYCFDGFSIARNINLPSTLKVIGEYAFSDCKRIEQIEIPENVIKIEKGAFNACLALKHIKLPKGLLDIGDNTFLCCTSLEGVRVPDTVSSIGENAFSGCSSIKWLIIPANVKFIDSKAFAYCPELTVYCHEGSYIHKYCMQNEIKYVTSPLGTQLPDEVGVED